MFGNAYVANFLDAESTQMVEDIQASLTRSKYLTNKTTYMSWVKYFYKGEGKEALIKWMPY